MQPYCKGVTEKTTLWKCIFLLKDILVKKKNLFEYGNACKSHTWVICSTKSF